MKKDEQTWSQPGLNLNLSEIHRSSDEVFLNDVIVMCQWVLFTAVGQALDIFGIGGNIINIACFIRQRFKDPVNVSLLGLAVADIGALLTLVWTNIWLNPLFIAADLPFDYLEVQYATAGLPHPTFTRISAWITAFITLERCLCITRPLQIKQMVTPTRAAAINIGIFVILGGGTVPLHVVNTLGFKFSPTRNRTVLGIIYKPDRERIENISFAINNVFLYFSSFVVIIVCTVVLVASLKKKNSWRTQSAHNLQADSVSNKNAKVAKMVVMISVLFLSCFTPIGLSFLAMTLVPGFSLNGQYRHILIIVGGFFIILESINSSANICFYYSMSSRYRAAFHEIFRRRTGQGQSEKRVRLELE